MCKKGAYAPLMKMWNMYKPLQVTLLFPYTCIIMQIKFTFNRRTSKRLVFIIMTFLWTWWMLQMTCKRGYCNETETSLGTGLTLNLDGVYFVGSSTLCLCLKDLT
jgi:hypothetical protein